MNTITEIQKYLTNQNIDAYILTRNNMFIGQDVLPSENKILELSGFDGSAGNMIIFRDKAYLLVDGRYDIQAREQTNPQQIEVVCTRDSIGSWIHNNIKNYCKFLYNPWCHSISEVDYWKRSLSHHEFIEDKSNILGNRISSTEANIFELEEQFAGVSSDEKISYLTNFCLENKLDAFLICECDCVSWLMNLRSDLIKNTPILRAFALVSANGEVSLFINDFSPLYKELEKYKGRTIGTAFNRTPKKIQSIIKEKQVWLHNSNNPIVEWKAIKNPIEIEGIKAAHIRDGVSVCQFLSWLENNYQGQDEISLIEQLSSFRISNKNFYSDSFNTIAGFGPNAAIIHYHPTPKTNLKLSENNVLLLDSGAQYFDGTTDITRTIAIGTPSQEIIDSYTEVLKAHIAVASAYFPHNTSGSCLDTLARATLWQYGKDYAHGTGHGVGHFLDVHEGPQSLSSKSLSPLKKDMILSIEPGFYKENEYGIRIENLAVITETASTPQMLQFTPLTLVPFDIRLINKKYLTEKEINYINQYHQKVFSTLASLVDKDTKKWLEKACQKI